jgi:tripartite-type tricarboxylate transporter receptor subunit TctC
LRPIKNVVPFPAGGPLDVVTRAMADKMAVALKQPLVLENKSGAGGNLGTDQVAKAAPDGYTLLMVLSSTLTVKPVPYRGNALLVTDLVAGQIKAGFVGSGGLFQHVRDGKVRALAISTPQRSPLLPDVPTIAESGYPEVKFGGYFVLAAPAGTPDAIVAVIEREARQALQAPDLKARLRAIDVEVMATSGAEGQQHSQGRGQGRRHAGGLIG